MEQKNNQNERMLFVIDDLVELIDSQNKAIEELRAENEILRFNLDKYRVFYEEAPDAYYINDTNGYLVGGNKHAELLTGFAKEELIGSNMLECGLLPPDQHAKALEILDRNVRGLKTGPEEFVLRRKDGSLVDVEISNIPVTFNEATFVLGIARDISKRKTAERLLLESEERYKSLFSNTHAVMLVISPDDEGLIVDANPAACNYYGYSHQEITSMKISQINTKTDEALKTVMNQALVSECTNFSFDHRLADGEIRNVNVYSGPIKFNNKTYLFSIIHDDTHKQQAVKALEESSQRTKALLEAIPDIVILMSVNGDYIDYKPDLVNKRGLSPRDVVGRNLREFNFLEEDQKVMISSLVKAVETGQTQTIQYEYISPGSDLISYECRLVAINDREVMGLVRDITDSKTAFDELTRYRNHLEEVIRVRTEELTLANQKLQLEFAERKNTESALQFNEYLLRAMNETSPLAFCIIDDKNSDLLYFNRRFIELWRLEHVEDRMKSGEIKFEELLSLSLPIVSDIPAFVNTIKPLLDHNNREVIHDTLEFINGKTISRFTAQIRDDDDKALGRLLMFEDITSRVRANEALKQSEAQLSAVFNNIPFLAWFKDVNTKYVAVNKHYADHFGIAQESFSGKTDYDIWEQATADKFVSDDLEVMLSKKQSSQEVIVSDNDRETWFEIYKSPIIDELGVVIGITGLSKDITERKLIEQKNLELIVELKKSKQKMENDALKLQALNKQLTQSREKLKQLIDSKDKFFSIIAHDLKDAFAGSLSLAELLELKATVMDKAMVEKTAVGINMALKQLYSLLSNLLDWSRSQMGKMEFLPSMQDIKAMVDRNINVLDASARRKQITINNNISEKHFAYCDSNMMNTVIRNLLSNALKYTRHKGTISIDSAILPGGFLNLSVTDNGIGMDEEARQKVFRIDTKYSIPGTDNERGTGLGLILCKDLIEKHGGSISVESRPGSGSTFSFIIPVDGQANR